MTLTEALEYYPVLPVISQLSQLQEFTETEGTVILPQAIIAVNLPDKCQIADGSVICDGCLAGKRCDFGTDCCFGVGCRFGDDCHFGASAEIGSDCEFGSGCRFGDFVGMPLWRADKIGSRNGTTYFFTNNNDIYVLCGCYRGFIDQFEARVKSVHKDNELYLSQYREAIATARDKYNEWLHNKNKRGEK